MILCKAISVETRDWVEGQYINCYYPKNHQKKKDETGHFIVQYPGTFHEIYMSTLCRCTNRRDLFDHLIYEHDYVLDENENRGEILWDPEEAAFYAKFERPVTDNAESLTSDIRSLSDSELWEVEGNSYGLTKAAKVRLTYSVELFVQSQDEDKIQDWMNSTTPKEAVEAAKRNDIPYEESYSEEVIQYKEISSDISAYRI